MPANESDHRIRLIEVQIGGIEAGRRLQHGVSTGQADVRTGVVKILANGDHRPYAHLAGALKHIASIFIEYGICQVGVGVHQHGS